jgi:hypothetical protein
MAAEVFWYRFTRSIEMNDAMKAVSHERMLGLAFLGFSRMAKVFSSIGPLSSFLGKAL